MFIWFFWKSNILFSFSVLRHQFFKFFEDFRFVESSLLEHLFIWLNTRLMTLVFCLCLFYFFHFISHNFIYSNNGSALAVVKFALLLSQPFAFEMTFSHCEVVCVMAAIFNRVASSPFDLLTPTVRRYANLQRQTCFIFFSNATWIFVFYYRIPHTILF